jgi:hypothetical protein
MESTMPNAFEYRVFKSTWGIYIRLTAVAVPYSEQGEGLIEITPELGLLVKPTNMRPVRQMVQYLTLGLQIVAAQVLQNAGSRLPLIVQVLKIEADFVDYQDEGLAAAMIGWAAQEFGFDPPAIPVEYDKSLRKYIFDFSSFQS